MKLVQKNNLIIEAVEISNVPPGMRGEVHFLDSDGRFYVKWYDGSASVVQERGEKYKIIDFIVRPKKNFWNIKNLFVVLLNKLKPTL